MLESLARIADKRGKKFEAATYRKEAQQVPVLQLKYSNHAAGKTRNASPAAAAEGNRSPPLKRPPHPWSPPTIEHPGSEGGTPGLKPKQPSEVGMPGEKYDPSPQR